MVAYSFQGRFVADIQCGRKRQTIRALRARRHARVGEQLQLFMGMRSAHCFKIIPDPRCVAVDEVRIDLRGLENYTGPRRRDGLIEVNGVPLIGAAAEAYARADGFKPFAPWEGCDLPATTSIEEMIRFWIAGHGFKLFEGVAIRWDPHVAPTIGGDTPDAAPTARAAA